MPPPARDSAVLPILHLRIFRDYATHLPVPGRLSARSNRSEPPFCSVRNDGPHLYRLGWLDGYSAQ